MLLRFPPRRILAAVDLTPPSMRAWRQAVDLAYRFDAALEAVYVEPWRTAVGGLAPSPVLAPERAKELRARLRRRLGERAKITVTEGDPAASIVRTARARRADLIVIGTHGRAGLARVLLGSVAEEVMRTSPVPVLAMKGRARPFRSVLAPVNFTSYSDHGFAAAGLAASGLGAALVAFHADLDPVWGGNGMMRLTRAIEGLPDAARERCEPKIASAEDAARAIIQESGKHDLVVLVAHKKPLLEDVVWGTTAERVLRGTRTPLLVIPPPARGERGQEARRAGGRKSPALAR